MNTASSVFLTIFLLMSLQLVLGLIQIKQFQKTLRGMAGKDMLGVGYRKGVLHSGEIIILAYDRNSGKITGCQSMRGRTIFAKFKECQSLIGKTLQEARILGLELDTKDMGSYRKKHPYDPSVVSKKKGALIQAVEAIERHLANDAAKEKGLSESETKRTDNRGIALAQIP